MIVRSSRRDFCRVRFVDPVSRLFRMHSLSNYRRLPAWVCMHSEGVCRRWIRGMDFDAFRRIGGSAVDAAVKLA